MSYTPCHLVSFAGSGFRHGSRAWLTWCLSKTPNLLGLRPKRTWISWFLLKMRPRSALGSSANLMVPDAYPDERSFWWEKQTLKSRHVALLLSQRVITSYSWQAPIALLPPSAESWLKSSLFALTLTQLSFIQSAVFTDDSAQTNMSSIMISLLQIYQNKNI